MYTYCKTERELRHSDKACIIKSWPAITLPLPCLCFWRSRGAPTYLADVGTQIRQQAASKIALKLGVQRRRKFKSSPSAHTLKN